MNYIDNLHEDLLGAVEFVSFFGSLACIIAGVFPASTNFSDHVTTILQYFRISTSEMKHIGDELCLSIKITNLSN